LAAGNRIMGIPLNQYIPKNDSYEINPYLKLLPKLNLGGYKKREPEEPEPL
jgi:hypothetical protein